MDLELATIYDISEELSNRGLQFIIAIQIINNDEPFQVHLCTDENKNKIECANALVPLFDAPQGDI